MIQRRKGPDAETPAAIWPTGLFMVVKLSRSGMIDDEVLVAIKA